MDSRYFIDINSKLNSLSKIIVEDKGMLPHLEDAVINSGTKGAQHALQIADYLVKNPKSVTMKYDGQMGIIFGCGPDKKFSVMDKWMFNNHRGRQVYSPQDFMKYDKDRGANRGDLYSSISNIWGGLQKSYGNSTGYFFGDLMYGSPLQEGTLSFKSNKRGITYSVNSETLADFLKGKNGFVIVHQQIPSNANSTDEAVSLNGGIGTLQNNSDVAIMGAGLVNTPSLALDAGIVSNINTLLSKDGTAADDLLRNPSINGLLSTFINKKVRTGNLNNLVADFNSYSIKSNDVMQKWIKDNQAGVIALFKIWSALYSLKMSLWQQLETSAANNPLQGQLDDKRKMQEGYVVGGYKIVNRANGFSRQNLSNQ